MMEDEYEYTAPCDDTVALESPISESRLLNIDTDTEILDIDTNTEVLDSDTNTEILDVCESTQRSGDQMEDYFGKEVVLDSDDEVGDYGAVNSANGRVGRLCGRGATGLLRRRQVPAGCFRRLDNKAREHVHLDSSRSDGESAYRFQKHHVVVDSVVSVLQDQKPISLNSVDPEFLNPERESLTGESLVDRKLSSHEYKPMNMGKVTNLNYVESSEDAEAESQDKALRFVDHYLAVNGLESHIVVQTRKTNVTKSPPPLRSKGSQSLAMRVNLGSSASKLKTFDWTEKQVEKDEYTSPRMREDSVFESKDDNYGLLSFNEEPVNVNLQNKSSNHQSKEKMVGNMLSSHNLGTDFLSSNCSENIGSSSGIHIVNDSMEFDDQLDARLSRDDVEKVEELSHVPDALDIGLDTQVAAEAMEELMHAFHPRFDACITHKGSDKTLMGNNCEPNHAAKYGETFVGWRSKRKRSKCIKVSNVQDKATSRSAVKRNGAYRAPSLIPFQQEENGFNKKCSLKEFKKYSRRSKRTTGGIKLDSSMKIDTTKREENSNLDGGDLTLSKLNLWVYPKRKRTCQHTPLLCISSSNECSPSPAAQNNKEIYPTADEEAQKLLVYNRRRKFALVRDQTRSFLKLSVDTSSSVNASPLSIETDANKLSNGFSMTSQILEGTGKRKQPSNFLPRSPLMKELMRLGYTGSLPDFLSKDSRRPRPTKQICVLFSQNLEEGTLKQQKKIVARLRLSIASCCSKATHFVADRFVRTRNMLEAIALGKPVVTHLWLENCEQAGYVIAEKSYILRDEKKEKEIGFNMPVSLSRAIKFPLLKGHRVLATPNVKPNIDVINSLIKAVQGQAVQNSLVHKRKEKLILDDLLIISCKEDYTICLPFLEKGACIYDSELLLNGIVTQKLEYERHRLFEDFKDNGQSCLS